MMAPRHDDGRKLIGAPANAVSSLLNLPCFEEQTYQVALSTAAAGLPPPAGRRPIFAGRLPAPVQLV